VAESWFLKIEGIEGASANVAHKGEIDVQSWSWGLSQTLGAPHTGGGGGGAGRPVFQDMHFTALISQASPKLFLSCASGTHHKDAQLTGSRGEKFTEFLTYKMTDVVVTSVQDGDTAGASLPVEQFSLGYATIEVSFRSQGAKGEALPPVTAGFDVRHNKKL
jgi:type VI secretion system secreted protein Hcp